MENPENQSSRIQLAGKPERVVNFIIDNLLILIFTILFNAFFIFSESFYRTDNIIPTLIFLIIHISYYSIFELISGQTLGKKITKTKVIRRGTGKIGFFRILIRTITRLFILDYYSYLFGYEIGMHDLLSNTIVVKVK